MCNKNILFQLQLCYVIAFIAAASITIVTNSISVILDNVVGITAADIRKGLA